MFERIVEIIEEQMHVADPGTITLETSMHDDLGADSLDAVEIVMRIEEEFDIEIPDEVALNIETVGDIMNYLEANI